MKTLVEKAKCGDKEAYEELFSLVYNDLYKMALSILRNPSDAKDAVQDTFLSAFKNFNTLINDASFKSWITKILKNKCVAILNRNKRIIEPLEDYPSSYGNTDDVDNDLSFDNMLKSLNDKEREIFKLKFKDGFTIKQISKLLNLNENTIKTILNRGKNKLRKKIQPSVFVLILCAFITTVVLGACLYNYIKDLFNLNRVGQNNDGVLYAIENLDWYQEINIDYINIDKDSKIKLEYLSMDEMNLYMIFDLVSTKDISKFDNITFQDLKVVAENNILICDTYNTLYDQCNLHIGIKLIENNKNNMKFLLFMYNDSFPISNSLDLNFSKIILSKKNGNKEIIYSDSGINFDIALSEKFLNRHYTSYLSDSPEIEKAIISETGFYAIINLNNESKLNNIKLLDDKNVLFNCYHFASTYQLLAPYKFIITSAFNDASAENLKLIINNKEYLLTRK